MTILLTIDPRNPEPEKIAAAVAILKDGGVVAYPAETFYALGAAANNENAVEKIFNIKGRAFNNPLAVIVAGENDLLPLVAEIPNGARILMKRFWPGPLTMVFGTAPAVSPRLTAGTGKIGIRISSHPIAALLARELGAPLTATSANLSGEPENATAAGVMTSLDSLPDAIIDGGETPGAPGSTILDVTVFPPRILREGAISGKLIDSALASESF
ncbi:MAG: L-threonylcarbamoyladenylate synthase [Syntrophales bacterium]|jgi:L-threonylcarbamoyladenylate synthase|nr:L-threonylcarbamoyladenylate synthase [Syntrophales bacterium]